MNSASLSAMHMSQSFHTISPLLKYSRLTFENGLKLQRSFTAGILSYFSILYTQFEVKLY